MPRLFVALVFYGVVNAAAYCSLVPLWEGFDEAYHYGYVQFLSTNLRFPTVGQTFLSREVWRSLELAPVSHYLQPYTGAPMSFADYFKLSQEERKQRRLQLGSLAPAEEYGPQTDKPNYEAKQAPLAYLAMAMIDRALLGESLPTRVLFLRLVGSIVAILLIAHSTVLLSRALGLPRVYLSAALFCIFSSQMLYATICHVSNDWVAVPLMAYLIWSSIRMQQTGSPRDSLLLGLAFSAALLTKAYFLFLAPLAFGCIGLALWRRRATLAGAAWFTAPLLLLAAPWYVRNLLLYRSLSGAPEINVTLKQLFDAAVSLPWRESIVSMAHSSLWTGNNSFTAFSGRTIDLMLCLVAVSGIVYLMRTRSRVAEWTVLAAVFLFGCGMLGITLAFYASSKGAVRASMPWYMQVLLAPVLLLCFLGMSRVERWARYVTPLFALLWGYVLVATYLVKLVPLYSGFPQSRMHWKALQAWYLESGGLRDAMLQTVCLVRPEVLWVLIGTAVSLDVMLCVALVIRTAFPKLQS
jgi:hypothetical protein